MGDMKKVQGITIANVTMVGDDIAFDVTIKHNSIKEAEVNPKWIVAPLEYTVSISDKAANVLMMVGSDLRIALAGRFRKTNHSFVAGLSGKTFSLNVLDALIDTNTAEDVDAKIAKLEAQLEALRAAQKVV
jgi:hypothetical protein